MTTGSFSAAALEGAVARLMTFWTSGRSVAARMTRLEMLFPEVAPSIPEDKPLEAASRTVWPDWKASNAASLPATRPSATPSGTPVNLSDPFTMRLATGRPKFRANASVRPISDWSSLSILALAPLEVPYLRDTTLVCMMRSAKVLPVESPMMYPRPNGRASKKCSTSRPIPAPPPMGRPSRSLAK